jgi:hypothetical protein
MLLRSLLAFSVLCSAAGLAPVLADEPMNSKQILQLAPGTFRAVVKGRWELVVTLARDGTVVGKAQGLIDRGRWTVRGDELCIVMPTWTRGRVECSAVVAESGWYRGRNVAFRPL